MIDALLSAIAPHSCYGCGEVGLILCDHCTNDIKDEPYLRCIFCLRLTSQGALCALCAERHDLLSAWCVAERRSTLRTALDAYKFERVQAASEIFARLLDESVPLLEADVVVTSIPTVPAHIRERGYDHAGLIAKKFAKLRGLTYRPLLDRTDTHTQHFSTRRERVAHAERAFQARSCAERVLLVDDIVTTGATIQAAARVLTRAGAQEVCVGIIARQPLDEKADL